MQGNEGINKLARTLEGRVKSLGDKPPVLDFGEIQGNMSLLTNKFPLPIPQSDYMVCRSVQWGAVDDIFYKTKEPEEKNSGEHKHGEPYEQYKEDPDRDGWHEHDVLIGQKFRWLEPGDRVLVAWVGDDAVVIDLVFPASRLGRDANSYE